MKRGFTMSNKVAVICKDAPSPIGPYSQAVKAGGMLYISGQLGIDPATGELPKRVEQQTELALGYIRAILASEGLTPSSVVKTTVFLDKFEDFAAMNGVYANFFNDGAAPARSCVAVEQLPKNALVEIEAIAVYT